MPIIDIQRRMVEAGRIRAGEKGAKGEPRKLDKWRLTSRDRVRLDEAGKLWGGEVREWDGQWELYTETDTLPIMLLPGQLPTTWYELWSRGGCQRRCDGQHELISDSACLCGEERECKPHTRLSVLLPDLPGIGSWLVTSTGWNAAAELAPTADILQRAAGQGVLIPARLRLEQRSEVKGGQTRRYAVPVLDLDVSFRDLLRSQGSLGGEDRWERAALPSGYVPIEPRPSNGVTLEEGLREAETQQLSKPPRVQLPEDDDILDAEDPKAPFTGESRAPGSDSPSPAVPSEPDSGEGPTLPPDTSPEKPLTKPQATKLNVLVGKLRDERGLISTDQLYAALAKSRNVDVEVMVGVLDGARDDAGDLHWGPLRDSLVRSEASDLIERLQKLEENAPVAA